MEVLPQPTFHKKLHTNQRNTIVYYTPALHNREILTTRRNPPNEELLPQRTLTTTRSTTIPTKSDKCHYDADRQRQLDRWTETDRQTDRQLSTKYLRLFFLFQMVFWHPALGNCHTWYVGSVKC